VFPGHLKNYAFIDTNSSYDWIQPRKYKIGQSDFSLSKIKFEGKIITFVSPDNSYLTITNELRKANKSIYLNIYEFTSPNLCDELVAALRRNISVNIFLEGSPVGGISDQEIFILNRLATYGGNIRFIVSKPKKDVYARYSFNHGKYLIIDNETIIVESCNWAKTGIPKNPTYGNREWGIIVKNKKVAEYFLNVFLDDFNPDRCDSYSFSDQNFSVSTDFILDKSTYSGYYTPQFESLIFNSSFSVTPVFSPDTSYKAVYEMIESAKESIFIEQLYFYKEWDDQTNPFIDLLVNKSLNGVKIYIILNYNSNYKTTNDKSNITKIYLEGNGIKVKYIYQNWSYFINVHNKGVIVDNRSVLISSINWNENSFLNNREAGIIIENENVSKYYAKIFFYDWNLTSNNSIKDIEYATNVNNASINENTIYILIIFTLTFGLIARDWRKRKWM